MEGIEYDNDWLAEELEDHDWYESVVYELGKVNATLAKRFEEVSKIPQKMMKSSYVSAYGPLEDYQERLRVWQGEVNDVLSAWDRETREQHEEIPSPPDHPRFERNYDLLPILEDFVEKLRTLFTLEERVIFLEAFASVADLKASSETSAAVEESDTWGVDDPSYVPEFDEDGSDTDEESDIDDDEDAVTWESIRALENKYVYTNKAKLDRYGNPSADIDAYEKYLQGEGEPVIFEDDARLLRLFQSDMDASELEANTPLGADERLTTHYVVGRTGKLLLKQLEDDIVSYEMDVD